MPKKLYIKTFGCQMNEYDSGKMVDVLHASDGMVTTTTPEDADVILFNTCSVREKAHEKVFSDLGRARQLKAANPHLIIGVGGCVASQDGSVEASTMPGMARIRRTAASANASRCSGLKRSPSTRLATPSVSGEKPGGTLTMARKDRKRSAEP